MLTIRNISIALLLQIGVANFLQAAPVVELTVGGKSHRGLNVAHNEDICWLAASDGSYQQLNLNRISSFRRTGAEFQAQSATQLGGTLKQKFQKTFEIEVRGRYVVCAPRGQAGLYADLLTRVEKEFSGYFSRRGWTLSRSPYAFVAIIHPTKDAFDAYCRELGMTPTPLVRGFYHPQTNQVVLYDQDAPPTSVNSPSTGSGKVTAISEGSRSVAVHEAIHQLAFNSGLHQRIGQNPRWVVEGLATMLEAGALKSTNRSDTQERINTERLQQFNLYRSEGRTGTIENLITKDEQFYQTSPLEFYSESWALTFYLSETRRPDYVLYLKRISNRDPLKGDYSAAERLADFQAVFGKDLRWLETQFLRFIDKL